MTDFTVQDNYLNDVDFQRFTQCISPNVGNSENGEGPHLHFEIWNNNVIIDPRNLIKEYKTNDVSIR